MLHTLSFSFVYKIYIHTHLRIESVAIYQNCGLIHQLLKFNYI